MVKLGLSGWSVTGLTVLGLIVLVVLGTLAIRFARHQALEEQPERVEDLLAPLEEAYRRGQMSDEEYLRVRRSLEGGEPPAKPPVVKPASPSSTEGPDLGEPLPGA